MKNTKKICKRVFIISLLLILLIFVSLQIIGFVLISGVRNQINNAEKVDLLISMYPNKKVFHSLTSLDTKDDIATLSSSLKMGGVCLFLDDMIGGGYIVRAYSKGGQEDIIIKRNGILLVGSYPVPVSGIFFEKLNVLIKKNDGNLPDWKKLFEDLKNISEE